jgi:hypothetical protein
MRADERKALQVVVLAATLATLFGLQAVLP